MFYDVQVYKLPTDRIYVTYFGGDEKLGLQADNEARDIWLKYLPAKRVLPFGCKVSLFTVFLLRHSALSATLFQYTMEQIMVC